MDKDKGRDAPRNAVECLDSLTRTSATTHCPKSSLPAIHNNASQNFEGHGSLPDTSAAMPAARSYSGTNDETQPSLPTDLASQWSLEIVVAWMASKGFDEVWVETFRRVLEWPGTLYFRLSNSLQPMENLPSHGQLCESCSGHSHMASLCVARASGVTPISSWVKM